MNDRHEGPFWDAREQRAEAIVEAGLVEPPVVRSQRRRDVAYATTLESCQCEDWQYRHPEGGCKHMRALRMAMEREAERKAALRRQALQDIRDIWGE